MREAAISESPLPSLDYAKAFRLVRAGLGVSQGAMAEAIGIQPNTLSSYEGGGKTPSFDTLRRLAHASGWPLAAVVALTIDGGELDAAPELAPLIARYLTSERVSDEQNKDETTTDQQSVQHAWSAQVSAAGLD